jgi:hypothetical protein
MVTAAVMHEAGWNEVISCRSWQAACCKPESIHATVCGIGDNNNNAPK